MTTLRILPNTRSDRSRLSFALRGQALVPVIFIMLILTTAVVAYEISATRSLRSSANFASSTQRFYAAKGALAYAASALAQTSANGATYGTVPPGPDTDTNGWMQVGDAYVKIDAVDTAGLININSITQANLQRIPVFKDNPDLVAAVLDWRNPASQAQPNGAQSDYYNGLTPPYDCKNGPYDTVEELLLVKGMTPTILYGNASGGAATNDGNSTSTSGTGAATRSVTRQSTGRPGTGGTGTGGTGAGGAGTGGTGTGGTGGATSGTAGDTDWSDIYGSSTMALSEMFTTVSRERNVAADGTLRVNINTASAQDLQTKLGISATLANGLVSFRSSGTGGGAGGNGTGGAGTGSGGLSGGVSTGPSTRSGRTRQSPGGGSGAGGGTGGTGGGGAGGTGGGGGSTSVFKSIADLMNVPGREVFDRNTMQRIADQITVDDQPYHDNLVNINTAPAEVLATVPGMDHNILQAIVDYRQGGKSFQSLGDLFTITSLTRQQFINVIGGLCAKSSIYRVRIRVAMPGQQGLYAITAIVEMTDFGPRVRQWREVTRDPGWSSWMPAPSLPAATPASPPGDTGTPVTTGNTN